jgi:hypothetical protein
LVALTGPDPAAIRVSLRALPAANLIRADGGEGFTRRHTLLAEAVVDDLLPAGGPSCTRWWRSSGANVAR